jgi:hypothetical protein
MSRSEQEEIDGRSPAVDSFDPDAWCALDLTARRRALAGALASALAGVEAVTAVAIEVGPIGREYDLTAMVETDVGRLRTPLWSHARATIFCDSSIHPANRRQLSPGPAVEAAADRLRRRLAVPFRLEARGLTITLAPAEGVERTWTAEHSAFRRRTAVVREDRVQRAGDLDVRDLLAHFYTGPSLRLVSDAGEPFLLPSASDAEGPRVTLCHACHHWGEGVTPRCPHCGSDAVDPIVAARTDRA